MERTALMIEDLIESIDLGSRSDSERSQAIIRILIGLTGALLAAIGAIKALIDGFNGAGLAFRITGSTMFILLGCFCLFNIALHRSWLWPGRGFWISLAGLFLVRIFFGA